jgi:deazaflavin-dependent oxidoreductase (nitroreductase family)
VPRRFATVYKGLNLVHERVFTRTKGRVFGTAGGMTAVRLTTIGRKSGEQRVTMLTSPLAEPDMVVLVASFRGGPKHPAWFHNLRANPEVDVMRRGSDMTMHAEILAGDERRQLWDRITALQPRYAKYQTRTPREIPLIVLRPSTTAGLT